MPGRSDAIVARALSVPATMSAGPPVWRDVSAAAMSANATSRVAAQPTLTTAASSTPENLMPGTGTSRFSPLRV